MNFLTNSFGNVHLDEDIETSPMEEKLFEPDYTLETPQEKAKRLGTTTTDPGFKICFNCGQPVEPGHSCACLNKQTQLNS